MKSKLMLWMLVMFSLVGSALAVNVALEAPVTCESKFGGASLAFYCNNSVDGVKGTSSFDEWAADGNPNATREIWVNISFVPSANIDEIWIYPRKDYTQNDGINDSYIRFSDLSTYRTGQIAGSFSVPHKFNTTDFGTKDNIQWLEFVINGSEPGGNVGLSEIEVFGEFLEACKTINSAGTHKLFEDAESNGTCITVNASSVTVNCQDFTITGNGTGYGVTASGVSNVVVENCTFVNFSSGINFNGNSGDSVIRNNLFSGSGSSGIRIAGADTINVTNNTFEDNHHGIVVSSAYGMYIERNDIRNSTSRGVYLFNTFNTTLFLNNVYYNLVGLFLDPSYNNQIIENQIFGNADAGLELVDSYNNTVINNTFYNNTKGVSLNLSENNTFVNNNLFENYVSFLLFGFSSGNNLSNNSIDSTVLANLTQAENLTAQFNYWNTTNATEIVARMFDYHFHNSLGFVDFCPYLNETFEIDSGNYLIGSELFGVTNYNCCDTEDYCISSSGECIAEGEILNGYECQDGGIWQSICGLPLDPDTVLELTGEISCAGDGIVLDNNSFLNCTDAVIVGDGTGSGIVMNDVFNTTVQGCNVTNFTTGIKIDPSFNNTLIQNNIYANSVAGLDLYDSYNNTIFNNTIFNNSQYGLGLNNSDGNLIYTNTIFNNSLAVRVVEGSSDNNFTNNTVDDTSLVNLSQADDFSAELNYWGTDLTATIANSVMDLFDNAAYGIVDFCPYLNSTGTVTGDLVIESVQGPSVYWGCCDDSTNCVNSSGECVSFGSMENDYLCVGDNDWADLGGVCEEDVVNITYPAASETVNDTLNITFVLDSSLAPYDAHYAVDGGDWINCTDDCIWNTSQWEDGEHMIQINDPAQDCAKSRLRLVVTDNYLETYLVNITSPLASEVVNETVNVTFDVDSSLLPYDAHLAIDGGDWINCSGDYCEWDTTSEDDGEHIIQLNDPNQQSAESRIRLILVNNLGTTMPNGSIFINNTLDNAYEIADENKTTSRSVVLNLNYLDDYLKDCRYANENVSNFGSYETCVTEKSWVLSEGAGNKTVFYEIRNLADVSIVLNDTIELEGNPPTTPVIDSSHVEGAFSNVNNVSFNWTSTDAESLVVLYSFTLDQNNETEPATALSSATDVDYVNLPDGDYWFHVKAYDEAGNPSGTAHYNVKISTGVGGGDIILFGAPSYTNSAFNVSGAVSSGLGNVTVNLYSNGTLSGTTVLSNIEGGFEFTSIDFIGDGAYTLWANATDNASNEYMSNVLVVNYDTDAPDITVISPGGSLGPGSIPFISVVTDEDAYCEYDGGEGYLKFQVTNNTRFHETILETDGSYDVRCTDLAGNSDEDTNAVSYSTGCSLSSFSIPSTILGNAGETVNFTASGIGCAAVHHARFGMTLNNVPVDVSARQTAGTDYLIQFQAPTVQDEYALVLTVNDISDSGTLDTTEGASESVNLEVTYDGGLDDSSNHIVYASENDYTVGIASDSGNTETDEGGNKITTNPSDGSVYIFVTEPGANVENRERNLEEKEFIDFQNPSFGYNIKKGKYTVQASINYDDIQIEGDPVLYDGTYTVVIKNKGINQTTGKVMVELKII